MHPPHDRAGSLASVGRNLSYPRRTVGPMALDIPLLDGRFEVVSEFQPAGDQPAAIADLERRVRRGDRHTVLLLLAIGLSVTVFRAAYEQIGNTVALWADSGVDRAAGAFQIPMTWFQSLNPLFVMLLTPPLLAYWRRHSHKETQASLVRRMALGGLNG